MPSSADLTREHRGGIEVRKRRRRRRVGQIVGRHVDGLHRGDGAFFRGSDALLEGAHFGAERRLVTDGRRHTAEERGHFGTCLGETEDVVNEQQHVLSHGVAEILGHGQGRESRRGALLPAARSSGRRPGPFLLMTPDSFISAQRSLPSRVRSPTPANTE